MKRFLTLFAALLLLLSCLLSASCSGNGDNGGERAPSPVLTDKNDALSPELIAEGFANNSTLPAMPGESCRAIEIGLLKKISDSPDVYTDPEHSIEYTVDGSSENINECRITGIKVLSNAYAIYGLSVGDEVRQAEDVFVSLGLEKSGQGMFVKGGFSVRIESEEGKITSFTIKNQ